MSNCWMRLSMISWYHSLSCTTDNTGTRFDNSWYHAKTKFINCSIIHFQTICKRWYFSLSLQKFEKTTWERGLETRQTLNSTRSSLPTSFKSEGNALTDPVEIADRLCKYFTNIGPNLARSIPVVNPSFRYNLGDNDHPSSDLKHTTTTELEIICCMFSLK